MSQEVIIVYLFLYGGVAQFSLFRNQMFLVCYTFFKHAPKLLSMTAAIS